MNRRLKPLWMMTAPADGDSAPGGGEAVKTDGDPQVFKQEDVDRIVAERLKREREATKAKYADYDDLKAKAEGVKTAEERIAELEKQAAASAREALVRRVQAAHGISDEDADLFLTGPDEETLTAQAARLAGRESERKKNNNVSPREGNNSNSGGTDEHRAFVRELFANAAQE